MKAQFAEKEGQKPCKLPFEEINLFTDRDIYLSGEKIWFTATCDIVGHHDQSMSQILYLELYNSSHISVVKNKYRLRDGSSHGTLEIPEEFLSGSYFLRAYTQYLKNFPPESYLTRVITIINPFLPLPTVAEKPEKTPGAEQEDKKFKIETDLSGLEQMHVTIINKSASIDPDAIEHTLILATENLQTIDKTNLFLNNKITHQTFPKAYLQNGINYLILKDKNNEVVLLNSFYYKDDQQPNIELNTNKQHYKPREIVELNIQPKNIDAGECLHLSVNVVKKTTLYNTKQVLEHFWNYPQIFMTYFRDYLLRDNISKITMDKYLNHCNELMNIADNHFHSGSKKGIELTWYPDIRDVSLSGIAVDEGTGVALSNVLVLLSAGKEFSQVHIYKTGEDGEFIFSLNNFEGDQEIFLCPIRWDKGDEPKIKIFSDFSQDYPELSEIPLLIDTSYQKLLEEMLINVQASQAFKTEVGKDTLPITHFPNSIDNPPISIVLDDYIETADMETVFRELVPRVRLKKTEDDYSLSVLDFDKGIYYDDPLILIDNIPVFNVNQILEILPSYIEKIEVHNLPLILGENIINGIIMLTTTTDDFAGVDMPPAATFLKYLTLSPELCFNPPCYDSKDKERNPAADFRTLLYWNPDLKVTSDTRISFYTSDHESEYEVVVRGRTAEGKQVFGITGFVVGK